MTEREFILASIGVALIVLCVDIFAPLGIASGVLYTVAIWLAYQGRRPQVLYAVALCSVLFLSIGAAMSLDVGVPPKLVLVNRLLSVVLILVLAWVLGNKLNWEAWRTYANRQLEDVFQESKEVICFVDPMSETVSRVNAAFCEFIGLEKSEAEGLPLRQLLDGASLEKVQGLFAQLDSGQPNHKIDVRLATAERQDTQAQLSIYGYFDQKARLYSLRLSFLAVAEVLDARSKLKDQETYHQRIVDAALDAIITINQQGQILKWNPAAEALFGWRREEVIGLDVAEVITPPSLRDAHREGIRRFMESGQSNVIAKRREITAMRQGGEEFPVELALSAMQIEGYWEFCAYVREAAR